MEMGREKAMANHFSGCTEVAAGSGTSTAAGWIVSARRIHSGPEAGRCSQQPPETFAFALGLALQGKEG